MVAPTSPTVTITSTHSAVTSTMKFPKEHQKAGQKGREKGGARSRHRQEMSGAPTFDMSDASRVHTILLEFERRHAGVPDAGRLGQDLRSQVGEVLVKVRPIGARE